MIERGGGEMDGKRERMREKRESLSSSFSFSVQIFSVRAFTSKWINLKGRKERRVRMKRKRIEDEKEKEKERKKIQRSRERDIQLKRQLNRMEIELDLN